MKTTEVQSAVNTFFCNNDHRIANCYFFEWESDFFTLTSSGYSVEVEVKVSKADFKKDFTHKQDKHRIFSKRNKHAVCLKHGWSTSTITPIKFVNPKEKLPNKFYYACPPNLISVGEVPEYAGLLYVNKYGSCDVVKQAPFLHKNKRDFNKELMQKYFFRHREIHSQLISFSRSGNFNENDFKKLTQILNRFH